MNHLRCTLVLMMLALGLAGCGINGQTSPFYLPIRPVAQQAASEQAISAENVDQLQEVRHFTASIGPVVADAFAPTGRNLATLGADRVARVWDVDSGRLLAELYDHAGIGKGVAYSPDGSRLITGGRSAGEDIILWDVDSGQTLAAISMTGYVLYDAAWAPDGNRFALVSRGSSRVFIHDANGVDLTQRRPSGQWLWSVVYGTEYLIVGDELGNVHVYEATGYEFRRELRHSTRLPARDLELSPDESLLAACFVDGTVSIWQTGNWALVTSFAAHEYVQDITEGCRDGAFTRNGDLYFTAGDDGWLIGWDPQTGEKLFTQDFGQPVWTVAVSADGELLVAGLLDGTLHILSLPDALTSSH